MYAFVRSALDSSVSGKPFKLCEHSESSATELLTRSGQPPRTQYPERPVQSKKPLNPYRSNIVPPANYGPVHGSTVQGLQGGTGGNETLNELGLVPQSVLLVKWDEEDMNGRSPLWEMQEGALVTIYSLDVSCTDTRRAESQERALARGEAEGSKSAP